jgi:hypothetical protein
LATAEYLEGFHNALKSSKSWEEILKLYNEIYGVDVDFDRIWKSYITITDRQLIGLVVFLFAYKHS